MDSSKVQARELKTYGYEIYKKVLVNTYIKQLIMIFLAISFSGDTHPQSSQRDDAGIVLTQSSTGEVSRGFATQLYGPDRDPGFYDGFEIEAAESIAINAGLNDAWYDPATSGQGFFITVFPDSGVVSLAWFTYDTSLPSIDDSANLGDPGHRWLTALGPIVDNQVTMQIEMTKGGLFNAAGDIQRTDPPGSDGTIILTFSGCNDGLVEYDIPSINRTGTVDIQRVASDNVALCEAITGTEAVACSEGPLDAPIPDCAPDVLPASGDPAQNCVDRINQFRQECQCLPPLQRWTEGEACADQHASYDSKEGSHAGFKAKICEPGGRAQNECPNYSSTGHVISGCLQLMWNEGPGPFPAHGHYTNMTNPAYSMVACGFHETEKKKVWSVQNFK